MGRQRCLGWNVELTRLNDELSKLSGLSCLRAANRTHSRLLREFVTRIETFFQRNFSSDQLSAISALSRKLLKALVHFFASASFFSTFLRQSKTRSRPEEELYCEQLTRPNPCRLMAQRALTRPDNRSSLSVFSKEPRCQQLPSYLPRTSCINNRLILTHSMIYVCPSRVNFSA